MDLSFVSWSGGKDSCFSLYLATRSGKKVTYLANMITEDGKISWSHGLSAGLLQLQTQAIGIPLVQRSTSREKYEAEFVSMLHSFKQEGIEYGVFGDIDFNPHREWIENVCRQGDIKPLFPLWLQNQDKIIRDFVAAGFEAVVVSAKAELFGEEILGRKVDMEFIEYLEELGKTIPITPCGEAGEYHTLVIDGPLFKKRVEILQTRKTMKEGQRFLEILDAGLRPRKRTTARTG